MSFTFTIDVPGKRERVARVFTDPWRLSGIFGHIQLLQVYDEEQKKYVTPEYLKKPTNKYKVLYVFGTPDTKLSTILGYMEGPNISMAGIEYKGGSDDGKMEWTFISQLTDKGDDTTQVRFIIDFKYKSSTLDRILGRSPFQLAEHMVTGHLVPYFKYFYKVEKEAEGVNLTEIYSASGLLDELLPKFREFSSSLNNGIIVIKGQDFKFGCTVINKNVGEARYVQGGMTYTSMEALSRLLISRGNCAMTVYELSTEGVLEKAMR